jgi:hypothetical protein
MLLLVAVMPGRNKLSHHLYSAPCWRAVVECTENGCGDGLRSQALGQLRNIQAVQNISCILGQRLYFSTKNTCSTDFVCIHEGDVQ